MEWTEVAKTIFYALAGVVAVWIGRSFDELKSDIKDLTHSVSDLNKNVAVVVERSDGHEKRISRLEERE